MTLRETTAELTHLDGKVPRTLKALFLKPGLLTRDFLEGRRALEQSVPGRLFGAERFERALSALAAAVYVAWHALVAMHRVFGESWPRTIIKAFLVSMVYSTFLFGAGLVIMALAFSSVEPGAWPPRKNASWLDAGIAGEQL